MSGGWREWGRSEVSEKKKGGGACFKVRFENRRVIYVPFLSLSFFLGGGGRKIDMKRCKLTETFPFSPLFSATPKPTILSEIGLELCA